MNEYLYHFTAIEHLSHILEDGFLKLTPSNLKEPKHLYWKIGKDGSRTLADPTDSYKPVVWLTSNPMTDPCALYGNNDLGLTHLTIRIVIRNSSKYELWQDWALKNHMKLDWYKRFTERTDFKSWFICTEPIPVNEFVSIEYLDLETMTYYRKRNTG